MKTKRMKAIAFIFMFICLTNMVYSQRHVSIHGGPAFPIKDYELATGLNAGLQLTHLFQESGLGLFVGFDFIYNKQKKSSKDDSKFLNLPVSSGLEYIYQFNDRFGLFFNGGGALNLLIISDMKTERFGQTITVDIDPAINIGFKIGGGVSINQNISLSVNYFGLGKHNVVGKIKINSNSTSINFGDQTVDILTLNLKINF